MWMKSPIGLTLKICSVSALERNYFLANSNATVVDSPQCLLCGWARNRNHPMLMASKSRQTAARMLVDRFGMIEAVREEIGKLR